MLALSLSLGQLTANYLRQGGYVFVGLCLFVCLCVSKITRKVMDGSF